MKILEHIFWFVVWTTCLVLFIWVTATNWYNPAVHYSVSQDRCIKVLIGEEWEPCSCVDLKTDKYIKVMVE